NARPTGSITAAPGTSAQAWVASSSVEPAPTTGAESRGCAPGLVQSLLPHEHAPATARAPGTTSQPHRPVYSATTVHSEDRPRRRAPGLISRVRPRAPIVKPIR